MGWVDFLFPKRCLNCSRGGKYLCFSCFKAAQKAFLFCSYCSKTSFLGQTHKKCQRRSGLDGLISIWLYRGIVRQAIVSLKYKFASKIALELAEESAEVLKSINLPFKNILLVPIPLHTKRKNWRGFNQAEEVGKVIAQRLGWKFQTNLLERTKFSKPQVGLLEKERKENVKNSFLVKNGETLKNTCNIFLFDDVWTTGSTLKEAAKALKKEGAGTIWGLTLAR